MRAMTVADIAREFGRSPDWVYEHFPRLVAEKKLPKPLIEKGGLTWSAAQVYALLDKDLTREQRATAAAFRAALDAAGAAASGAGHREDIEAAKARITTRFAGAETS